MKHVDNTIRQANRKALPKFLLILAFSFLVGGIFGFSASYFGLDGLGDKLALVGAAFSLYIAPWLLAACTVLQPLACIPLYRSAKKRFLAWDGEDESVSQRIERNLSLVLWITGMFSLASLFFLSASYAGPVQQEDVLPFPGPLSATLFFILTMAELLLIQQRAVDLSKRMAPEKQASIYDVQFQKKWFESCDEAERLIIGQCAYKAYAAISKVCTALWLVFTLSALFLNTGLLPILAVCIIWTVGLCVYSYWSLKLSAPGTAISGGLKR